MKMIKPLLVNVLMACAANGLAGCSSDKTDGAPAAPAVKETGLSACQKDNAVRPGEVLDIVNALSTAIDGKGDSSKITLYSMPNHQSAFWDTPKLGYEKAKQELGTLGDWVFPPPKTAPLADIVAAQKANIAAWVSAGASGIALSAKSPADMTDSINSAVSTGIPVVSFDSDAVASNRFLYVGPLNQPAGILAGTELVKALGTTKSGVVVILTGATTETLLEDRVAGARIPLEAAGFTVEAINGTLDANVGTNLDAAFAKHGDMLKGVITVSGTFAPIAGAYLRDKGYTGKVQMVAWDVKVETQALLDAGVIHAMVAQRSYFHGYLPVYLNYAISVLGKEKVMSLLGSALSGPKGDLLNTGMDVVTKENLASYLSYQTECLGVASN